MIFQTLIIDRHSREISPVYPFCESKHFVSAVRKQTDFVGSEVGNDAVHLLLFLNI